jgi:hypothetical protein
MNQPLAMSIMPVHPALANPPKGCRHQPLDLRPAVAALAVIRPVPVPKARHRHQTSNLHSACCADNAAVSPLNRVCPAFMWVLPTSQQPTSIAGDRPAVCRRAGCSIARRGCWRSAPAGRRAFTLRLGVALLETHAHRGNPVDIRS